MNINSTSTNGNTVFYSPSKYTMRQFLSQDASEISGEVPEEKFKPLFICYLLSSIIQLALAIVVLVYGITRTVDDPIPNQYLVAYEGYALHLFDTLLNSPDVPLSKFVQNPDALVAIQNWWNDRYFSWYVSVGTFSSGFLFITAIANLIQAAITGKAMMGSKTAWKNLPNGIIVITNGQIASRWLILGRNPVRWIEYAFSASWMVVLIGILSTIQNVMLLGCMAVLNAVVMVCGFLHEVSNPLTYPGTPYVWGYYIVGWLICIVVWAPILGYFALMVTNDLPAIVIYIVAIQCVMFFSFSVVPLYIYRPTKQKASINHVNDAIARYYKAEYIYIGLSLTVKIALAALVFFGGIGMDDNASLIG